MQIPNIFVSYQTSDKSIASTIKYILENVGYACFLAHEDIEVSEAWRERILKELERSDIFISLLSSNYSKSPWCIQESGIAAFREITIIPLSLDGSIPQGFLAHIQANKISPSGITIGCILPGLIKHDFALGIDVIINVIGQSKSFREAEDNFRLILPYIDRLSDLQMGKLLNKVRQNGQIHSAGKCASEYIPPLLARSGHLLKEKDFEYLQEVCSHYMGMK